MTDPEPRSEADYAAKLCADAEAQWDAGEWALAAATYREAFATLEASPAGGDRRRKISVLLNLASTLLTLRDDGGAETALNEAQALADAGGAAHLADQLKVLNGIAALHATREDAAALERTALEWRSRASGIVLRDIVEAATIAGQAIRIMTRLGGLLLGQRKTADAVRWLLEARGLAQRIGEAPDLRPVLYYLAQAHALEGKTAEAELHAAAALARVEADELRRGDAGAAAVLELVAYLVWQRGRRDAAIFFRKCALAQSHTLEDEVVRHRSADYTEHGPERYRDLTNMLVMRGRLAEAGIVRRAADEAELFALVSRNGPLDPRRTMTTLTPREERWRRELVTKLAQFRALRQRLGLMGPSESAQAAQWRRIHKAEMKLKSWCLSLDDAGVGPDAIEIENLMATVRRSVPTGSLVVSTVTTATRLAILHNGPELCSFLIRDIAQQDLAQRVFALRSATERGAADIAAEAAYFLDLLGLNRLHELAQLSDADYAAGFKWERARQTAPPAPVPPDFEGPRHILLDLDGPLRQLPIAALGDTGGWLIERAALTLLDEAPSTQPLAAQRLVDDRSSDADSHPRIAALGTSAAHHGLPALPGVAEEIAAIVGGAEAAGAFPGIAVLDSAFTREALRDAARSFPILHIASHFEFHPTDNRASGLLLGDGSLLTLGDLEQGGFDFSHVRLVTLSACETGVTGMEAGRNLMSLASVLRQLGAGGIVATLWRVPDDGTARLMRAFYRALADGHDVAEALRRAQLLALGRPARPWSDALDIGGGRGPTALPPLAWAGIVYITGTGTSEAR